ncbi:VCBS domain-containing protein [Bradyrhizobium sp. LVM 105]|uniref:VCBS domain-containing protein n=1 Tax=Bradyrhizobium sp. LVM 105 TaxID=2341115 RepID=UPI001FDFBC44|nr:VCBS domain-containing protein [Bradyrhizobium sp. LVM 105]
MDGQGSRSPGNAHVDSFTAKAHGHVPEGAFVVPDPNLIFNGEFKRTGLDLVLSHEGHEFVVHDYFRGDKRAALASPDGAHLTGEIVSALTGHVQVAQAAPGAAAAQVIGHVTKLVGSATAIRNGVSVILNNGDNVEKGDVVSTGADSTLGITFIDGTVFGLSSNARMVLNEMVYDPNGSSNSSLLSLVAGTITFVAGETAKHGDMKIDTPVATMGIRGTAVLTQINFVVPAGGGDPQPQASFQVLVEPNGTTGSYILFDKVTLLPIATVNQAGQMIQISGGNVSISNALMSPDVQKLITDVFTLKFTDNNTNTKLTTNFTDTLTPMSLDVVFKSSSGPTAVATFVNLTPQGSEGPSTPTPPVVRIPGQPIAQSFDASGIVKTAFALTERAGATGDTHADTITGLIRFVDQNLGDKPTVSISLAEAPNYVYKDAGQHDVTGSLTDLQKHAIAATQIQISVVPDPGNNNNGSAIWTYTLPDHVFDFLAAGETVTLTYMVRVDTNFAVNPESKFIPITITITGTNDKPAITTDVPIITFEGGTSVPGGPLTSDVPTSGTLNFNDVDLTDKHTVSVALTSATLPDGSVPPGPLAAFQSAMSVAIAAGADSTGDGTGTINWSLADLPVYLADFIPQGAVLTLVYTVTLTDSQGAASQQTITVTITGTDAPAVVWIATDKPGVPSGGFWKDAGNWATGTVPTDQDDVIVITDQLHGLTPSYPVTIDVAAFAKSLTLDDYDTTPGHKVPEVINESTLTIGGKLTLNADAKFTNSLGGHVTVGGAIDVETITRTSGVVVTNTSTITNEGTLTLEAGGTIDTLTAIANSGLIDLSGGTLVLKSDVTNSGGTIQTDAGATLVVDGATIDGGTVAILGTLESTGISAIDDAEITIASTGMLSVTSGTLTIDPATIHAITNQGLIEAVTGGTLKLTAAIIANTGGTISVDNASKLYLTGVSINGGSLSNAGNLYSVSGSNTITAGVTNTGGTIKVQAGTLNLAGGIIGAGTLIIENGAKLELGGADAQNVTFAGGTGTLQLDKVAGQSFTGTISGELSADGIFTITGNADITTSTGDALDFTVSQAAHAGVVLTPTGTLTGAINGIDVTQNGVGDITLTATGDITGLAGHGIWLSDSATGSGDITVNDLTGKATGTGANSVGVLVENINIANAGDISITQLGGAVGGAYGIDALTQGDGDIIIDAGGAITGSSIYGIRSRSYGSGNQTVTTEAGSAITSGSSGIVAVNRANSLDAADLSTITVNAYGTINSGSSLNLAGNAPAGIEAGYTGATTGTSANTSVNATVIVNNHAAITAVGHGINAFNYGNGDVTVNSFAGTAISVSGAQSIGINAAALSGGTGDVTVTLGEDVTISGATSYGIRAYSLDAGDITVTLADGDNITSGSSGIVAVNYAVAIAAGLGSTISVEAHGAIHSGATLNNDGTTPGGIIAGYKPGGTGTFSSAVNGDVIVASDATITAGAGYGIEAFTWGAGDVTVTTGALSSITAAGIAIGAFNNGGGDVSVTNQGSAIGSVGLAAVANGAGDITIVNDGSITSTNLAGISVTQNAAGATGSTHITNTGSIAAPTGHTAIFIQENATGTATIDNSGTIGPAVASSVTSATYAIVETGGAVEINNTGDINGNISVARATFNNNAGGTWTVAGTSVFGNASSIINHGDIDLLNGASISGTGLSIENDGDIDSWGTASISGTITNTGNIEVNGGTLTLFGSLSGTGSVTVDAGALLKLEGTVAQTITLEDDGAGLQIDTATFGGSIAGLSANDTIDLSTINYGLGTSAVYVANSDPSTGGVLTVSDSDGHQISLNLTGADYSDFHFAGSSDGHGGTLITIHANDDAPTFTATEASPTLAFSELENTTGSTTLDPVSGGSGTVHFKDIDLTDRPTATITHQATTWLAADHSTELTLTSGQAAALEQALAILGTGKNNGAVDWSYSIVDSALDFLGEGQTATVVSTITLDDHQGQCTTADVTVTITGKNDAPTLNGATLGAISEDATAPAGSSVGALFAAGFHDADAGASFKAVAVTASHATAAEGVWQYHVAGSNQWIDIAGVSDSSALVLATDTLVRFVPAANFSGAPGSLDVHALDDTYGGNVTTPVLIDITSPSIGSSVSAAATLSTEVTPVADAPAFNIDHTPIADAGEFLVNTTTANDQTYSAIGALSDGGYVIAWVSQGQDGDGAGIYAQHYASSGAKIGGEFRVNTATAGSQSSPYVVGLEGGGFVVSWTTGSDNGATIHLQRFDSSGSPAGGEVSLAGYGENATLAALSNGGFVISYVTSDASASGTYGIVYDSSGVPTSGPFLINTTTASQQQGDSVAGTADGGFVASWHSYGQDEVSGSWGVYFQRFDAQGNKLGGEVQVNTNTAGDQYGGELAVLKDGSIVVSYTDANTLVLRHFSSTGAPIGNEVSISDATTATLQALPDGGFLVTYQGHDAPGSLGLLGQRFDASLHAVGSSFVINETTTGDQLFLADRSNPTAVTSDGKIVSTWFSPGDGGNDVEARVFAVPGFGSNSPIKLPAITAAAVDSDGSETLLIKLSGYPAGATFSVGHAGTGADAGQWLIGAAEIASLAASGLTMTAPAGYHGEFNLHVGVTVIDSANGLGGPLTDTYTITEDVVVRAGGGPVIDTSGFQVEHIIENSNDIITDLVVIDTDPGAATDTFTVTLSTANPDVSLASVYPTAGTLEQINAGLAEGAGIAYDPIGADPDAAPPATDQITLTVADSAGHYDTVNFIFVEGADSQGITLEGTSGKDVIFATESSDTLTGGGAKDQFVFAPTSSLDPIQHAVTDFETGLDKIDLRQFTNITSWTQVSALAEQQGADTLLTLDANDKVLLKNVVVGNLHASDFILHVS